jgi:polysaccharide export outer membrane protein
MFLNTWKLAASLSCSPFLLALLIMLLVRSGLAQCVPRYTPTQDHASISGAETSPPETESVRLRIGPGDLLQINVFDEPELTQSVRVSDNGDADLMLIGSIHLEGLTTSQAKANVEDCLRKVDFMLHPSVSITIQEYGTQGVSVLGEVKNPGVYRVLGSRNLLDLISQAGGTTPIAAGEAVIKRRSGKQEKVKTSLSNNPDQLLMSEVAIEPGDTVVIPRAGIIYVLGEVNRPGAFVMQYNGKVTLLQAIAFASGAKRTSSESKTRLIHQTPVGFQEVQVNVKRMLEGKDPDIPLQPQDIIYIPTSVPKSFLVTAPQLAQSAASAAVFMGIQSIP